MSISRGGFFGLSWIAWIGGVAFIGGLLLLCVYWGALTLACAELAHIAGVFGWGVLVVLVGLFFLHVYVESGPERGGNVESDPKRRRKRPARAVLFGGVVVALGFNLATGIGANRLERYLEKHKQRGVEAYRNHDLAKLTGQSIRIGLLQFLEPNTADMSDRDQVCIAQLASTAPERWLELIDSGRKGPDTMAAQALSEDVVSLIEAPSQEVLGAAFWQQRLSEWQGPEEDGGVLSKGVRWGAAESVARNFGTTVRELLKADFAGNGQAWAATQLEINREALQRLASIAERIEANHQAVLDGQEKIRMEVVGLRGIVEASAVYAIVRMIDESHLSEAAKRDEIQQCLNKLPNTRAADSSRTDVPADIRRIVTRIYAAERPVRRFAALALVGRSDEADRLAAEIERNLEELPPEDHYTFFVSRAECLWMVADFHNAGAFYGDAMRLRQDVTDDVVRAAESIALAPGSATHAREIEIARGWLERCAHEFVLSTDQDVFDRAEVHRCLSLVLAGLGRVRESLAAAEIAVTTPDPSNPREGFLKFKALQVKAKAQLRTGSPYDAIRTIEQALAIARGPLSPGNYSVPRCASIRVVAYQQTGQFAAADADLKLALEWQEKREPLRGGEIATLLLARSDQKLLLGKPEAALVDLEAAKHWKEREHPVDPNALAGIARRRAMLSTQLGGTNAALQQLQSSVTRLEAKEPQDRQALAVAYIQRGSLLLRQDMVNAAAIDIERSIRMLSDQASTDNRTISLARRIRASLRDIRGDYVGALEDLTFGVDWFEDQPTKNQRDLGLLYSERAVIHQKMQGHEAARRDIESSIEALQEAYPDGGLELISAYASRATVGRGSGRLAEAASDLQKAIDWLEQRPSVNQRTLQIFYGKRASIRRAMGDLDGALVDSQTALDWFRAQTPQKQRSVAMREFEVANVKFELGALKAARALTTKSLHWLRGNLASNHWGLALRLETLARIELQVGNVPLAQEALAEVLSLVENGKLKGMRWVILQAEVLAANGEYATAVRLAAEAVSNLRSSAVMNDWSLARLLLRQARVLVSAEKWSDAKPVIEQSLRLHRAVFGSDHRWTRDAAAVHGTVILHR